MHPLKVEQLTKSYVSGHPVVEGISFEVEPGEIIAVVGASGSGKTTLLRLLAGFEQPDKGEIYINEKPVWGKHFVRAEDRQVGFVFQDLALFPHLSVENNILFGVKNKHERSNILSHLLSITGLTGLEKRFPWQLSGGQQQRVAIARALALRPAILLMDEPFSSLDQALKVQLRVEIKEILIKTGITTIIVSHDIEDAYTMANRMLVLEKGKLAQFDTPEAVYKHPPTRAVALLGGKANFIPGNLIGESTAHEIMVRPENIQFVPGDKWLMVSRQFNGGYFAYVLVDGPRQLIAQTHEFYEVGSRINVQITSVNRFSPGHE